MVLGWFCGGRFAKKDGYVVLVLSIGMFPWVMEVNVDFIFSFLQSHFLVSDDLSANKLLQALYCHIYYKV